MTNKQSWFWRNSDEIIGWSLGILFWGGIGLWILLGVIMPNYNYANASSSGKCQIDLKKQDDSDKFCDSNYKILSKKVIAEDEAVAAEVKRRTKLSPYDRCVEDRDRYSGYNEDGGLTVCKHDGTTDYISESEIEEDIEAALSENNAPPDNCHPSYSPCIPNVGYDLDCADIGSSVTVHGYDEYNLDRDGDGYGCEPY